MTSPHTILQSPGSLALHGLSSKIEDAPWSLVEKGYIREDSISDYLEMFNRIDSGSPTAEGDFWVARQDGSGYWCERVVCTSIFDEGGKPLKAYGTSQDVTSLKHAQRRYEEEILYRSSVANSIIATCRINLTKHIVEDFSSGSTDFIKQGYGIMDFKQRTAAFLSSSSLTEEQNQAFSPESLLEAFRNNETSRVAEYYARLKNGQDIWLRADIKLMLRPDTGDVISFCYHRDITRKMIIKQIADRIIQQNYDLVACIDIRKKAVSIYAEKPGTSLLEQLNQNYDCAMSRYLLNYVIQDDYERVSQSVMLSKVLHHLQHFSTYTVEFMMHGKNNNCCCKQLLYSNLNKDSGLLLMVQTDITDLVQKEQEHSRTLKKALLAAKDASTLKSEFLARMSHDMRTPMNAIMGITNLARNEVENKQAVLDYLAKIDYSSHFLLGLINDILDMSKIESGEFELHPVSYEYQEFISTIETMILPLCKTKGVGFIFDREPAGPPIFVDKVRFNQIFLNILSNSVKFTPAGGTIQYKVINKNIYHNRISCDFIIQDNGIGMSEQFQKKLFQPFMQENTAAATELRGTGLGLAISKSIVDRMGGSIVVESKQGKGSKFTLHFDLPLDVKNEHTTKDQAQKLQLYSLREKNILLVEDHPLNTVVATKLLASHGCNIAHAENGRVGVDLFFKSQEGYFDAILMDIRMPVMDGLAATAAIRSLERNDAKSVPIIAMTANAYDEDIRKSKEAGLNDHLAKPIEPKVLYETLAHYLQERSEAGLKKS